MPDYDYNKLHQLFAEAMKLDTSSRRAFFEKACGADKALRSELESMIREAEETVAVGDLLSDEQIEKQRVALDRVLDEATPHASSSDDDTKTSIYTPVRSSSAGDAKGSETDIPPRIGRYKIMRAIASGGMGTVYEGIQQNPERNVAIKVMKKGIASKSALRRFEYESQLLARLRHPAIAQVYEAGTHNDGDVEVPYFAMEFIDGARSMTSYARKQNLRTRDRLKLFAEVCEAVHHGHQRGIIHRDLKPSNILVDASGHVKVIDFGVARSTDSDMAVTTLRTDVGQLIGTLQYMSPEQCAADPADIDTRSDVYALGVILYELLCDQVPYNLKGAAIHEAVRVIREDQPTQLSTHDRTLRGDIETIALKALAKDRDRRYQSASALTADIDRYLNGEAISARPPSMVYQLQVFARRHKGAAAAVIAVILTLAGGLVASDIQRRRAVDAEELASERLVDAEEARDEAEQVAKLLTDTLGAADPSNTGKDVTVREVMDHIALRVGEEFAEKPLVEARMRQTIGWTYRGLGYYPQALDHLAEAAAIYTRELGSDDERTMNAVSSHAATIGNMGNYSEAEVRARSALDIQRRVLGPGHRRTLLSTSNLAGILLNKGNYEEAEALCNELYDLMQNHLGEKHRDTLRVVNNLAVSYLEQGRYEDAIRHFGKSLQTKRKLFGRSHPQTMESLHNLAITMQKRGKFVEAQKLLRECLDIRTETLGLEHPETLNAQLNLANSLYLQGHDRKAEQLYRKTLETQRRVLGKEHPYTLVSMNNVALSLNKQGRYSEMEPLIRETLELRQRVLGDKHPQTLDSTKTLGICLRGQKRYEEAVVLFRQTLERQRNVMGPEHPLTLSAMGNVAGTLVELGSYAEAESLAREMLIIVRKVLGERHHNTLKTMEVLADSLHRQQKFSEAAALRKTRLDVSKEVLGNEHPDTLESMGNLALTLTAQEQWTSAETLLTELLSLQQQVLEATHPKRGPSILQIIEHYDSWHAAEPGNGYDAKAAEWKMKATQEQGEDDGN